MKYIETFSNDPCYNLAFEEYILTHCMEGDWLILWQNDNTVVVGRNQNTAEEINAEFIKEHNITVVRRMTGGGAVYHDMQNLNYSFICDAGDTETLDIKRFAVPVCRALEKMGVSAELSGRNDIIVDGKKVSGVAQRIYKNRILHHGTLLFKSDPEMISGALKADPEKFRSKSAKSVRSRVGNIWDFLPEKMSLQQFWNKLRTELANNDLELAELKKEELEEIDKLADEKYRSWDWVYGKNPAYSFVNKIYCPGGSLQVKLNAVNGRISEIAFAGDYMATGDDTEVREALTGLRLERKEIDETLSSLNLVPAFGGVLKNDILDAIFIKWNKNSTIL